MAERGKLPCGWDVVVFATIFAENRGGEKLAITFLLAAL